MYYPIIDKLKEVMSSLTRLESTEPFIIEGTITDPVALAGTWDGEWSDVLDAFNNGYPVWFRVRQPIGVGKININVPLILCENLQDPIPTHAQSALAFIQYAVEYIDVNNDNTFVVVSTGD